MNSILKKTWHRDPIYVSIFTLDSCSSTLRMAPLLGGAGSGWDAEGVSPPEMSPPDVDGAGSSCCFLWRFREGVTTGDEEPPNC